MIRERCLLVYRIIAGLCLGGILLWIAHLPSPSSLIRAVERTRTLPRLPLTGVTIVLDPGHGGTDSGYRRRDCREDALNYRFTATLAQTLIAAGANVLFTVKSAALDVPLAEGKPEPPPIIPSDAVLIFNGLPVHGTVDCLHERAARVRAPYLALDPGRRTADRCLYFLAIHHDAYSLHYVRGGHVLFDRRDGGAPRLAHILARRLSETGLARNKYAGQMPASDARQLGVLNPNYNPVPERVLLEVATISNPHDRELALSSQWRWRYAHLITDAIVECER